MRTRAVDDATRRAVESDIRRYEEYRAIRDTAEIDAARAAGTAPVLLPDHDHPRVSGGLLPGSERMLQTVHQYRGILSADDEYQRARRVVDAIDAAYRAFSGQYRHRQVFDELKLGRVTREIAAALHLDESVVRKLKREVATVTFQEFQRLGVATYADGESA